MNILNKNRWYFPRIYYVKQITIHNYHNILRNTLNVGRLVMLISVLIFGFSSPHYKTASGGK